MTRLWKIAFCSIFIVTLLAIAPALISPGAPARSPYVSAMSIDGSGAAAAARHCNDRACGASSKCERAVGFNCLGRCQTRQCF